MKFVWIIAHNTFREIIRDRVLYGILIFSVLLIGLSLALGQLSFSEQARISANFGFTGIHLSSVILAVFMGSSLVAKEIEKQTILTLLARPISRLQFLAGKFLGLTLVLMVMMVALAFILSLTVYMLELSIQSSFVFALIGIWIESLLLLSLTLFFSSFAKPILTVSLSASIFILGHWVGSLRFFSQQSQSEAFHLVSKVILLVVPDLESFNWRSAPVYLVEIPTQQFLHACFYGAAWITFLFFATTLAFRRRDFV